MGYNQRLLRDMRKLDEFNQSTVPLKPLRKLERVLRHATGVKRSLTPAEVRDVVTRNVRYGITTYSN